jgi:hypothetical protein
MGDRFMCQKLSTLILIFAFASLGCATHHWTAPSMEGDVIDAKTGAGLSGVTIMRRPKGSKLEERVGTSDGLGHFNIAAKRKLIVGVPILVYLGDHWYSGTYSFEKAGFKPAQIEYQAGYPRASVEPHIEANQIRLEQTTRTN